MLRVLFNCFARLRDAWLVRWWRLASRALFDANGATYGADVRCYGLPIVSRASNSDIVVGDGVILCSHPRFTALGVSRPVILRTLRPGASIRIGANSGLSGTVICSAVSVTIGHECLFGADVQICDTDFHPVASQGRRYECPLEYIPADAVVIEENVFLGAGVKVLKGAHIGRNSVIGAGSVVSGAIPANSIAAGVPARVISPVPEME